MSKETKTVLIKATISYNIEVPIEWDNDMIEFHRNESSWCASSMIEELTKLDTKKDCLCGKVVFEVIG